LDFCLLAAGVVSIALSFAWRAFNPMMNLVLDNADLTAGLILGIALLITFFISIGAIVQRNHVTIGLVILNWALVLDVLGILIIGTFVWFFTLMERNNFHKAFQETTPQNRIAIQDKFHCCGYFNTTDLLEVGGNTCSSQQAAQSLNSTCVNPITSSADVTLNDIFTTIYGFMAIVLALLLASLCVIKKRQEDERFKKIDAKRGGRGFV